MTKTIAKGDSGVVREGGEDAEVIAIITDCKLNIPANTVQMVRGDVTAAVAPQDVDGFKSAGYSVIN